MVQVRPFLPCWARLEALLASMTPHGRSNTQQKGFTMKAIALAIALSLAATMTYAQDTCAPYRNLVNHLSEKYGEALKISGDAGGSSRVEWFANEHKGTWTAVVVRSNGIACIAASGIGHEQPMIPAGKPV